MSTVIAERERDLFSPIEQAALLPPGSISLVGLELDIETTFEDWQEIGRKLGHVHRWSSWALGDWLNFGETVYGQDAYDATEGANVDRYDMAGRITGLAHGTLANYASICARIARSRRRVELFFSTHEPVAALTPEEQVEWLQRAVDEGWGRSELRDAIRDSRGETAPEPEPAARPEVSRCERAQEILALFVTQAQAMTNGGWFVPDEVMAQAVAAHGGE